MGNLRERDEGFTLIELLVVILIVSILAAIAIPTFLNQRRKGYEGQMRSTLRNAATAVESYGTGAGGDYSGLNFATNPDYLTKLSTNGYTVPSWLMYLRVRSTRTTYCIEARHNDLTAGSGWRRATFQSSIGVPQPTPNICP